MADYPIVNVAAPINWAHPLMSGLVSRWKVLPFGQWAGGTIFKDLCRVNDGTLTGGAAFDGARGRPGGYGSVLFDGSNDYVAAMTLPSALSAFSISMWVNMISAGNYPCFLARTSYTVDLRTIDVTARPQFATNEANCSSADALTLGQWYHLTATADTTGCAIYVDGVQKGTGGAIASTLQTFELGRRFDGQYANVRLDDVRIRNRVLSASEEWQSFNLSRQPYDPTLNWLKRRNVKAATAAATGSSWYYNALCGAA